VHVRHGLRTFRERGFALRGRCALHRLDQIRQRCFDDDELKLIVRLVPGKQLDPAEFLRWCEPRLPYFQIPRYLETIAEFPKTPTQRVRKNQLARSVENAIDLSTYAAPPK